MEKKETHARKKRPGGEERFPLNSLIRVALKLTVALKYVNQLIGFWPL